MTSCSKCLAPNPLIIEVVYGENVVRSGYLCQACLELAFDKSEQLGLQYDGLIEDGASPDEAAQVMLALAESVIH